MVEEFELKKNGGFGNLYRLWENLGDELDGEERGSGVGRKLHGSEPNRGVRGRVDIL